MTHAQRSYFKKNWLTMANFVILILIFFFKTGFTSGKEVQTIKGNISQNTESIVENTEDIKEHEDDETVHMPFKEKIKIFVPRVELDSRLENIEKTLVRIEKNQNRK